MMPNEIYIYGTIGLEVNSLYVIEQLAQMEGEVIIRFNSAGGSLVEGNAIHNAIKRYKGKTIGVIDGAAMSACATAAMACDELHMAANAIFMIHNPWSDIAGDAKEFRKEAEMMEKAQAEMAEIYAERSGLAVEEVAEMMAEESYLSAEEALELGFIDAVTKETALAMSYQLEKGLSLMAKKVAPKAKAAKKPAAKKPLAKKAAKKPAAKSRRRAEEDEDLEAEDEEEVVAEDEEELEAEEDEDLEAEDEEDLEAEDEEEEYVSEEEEIITRKSVKGPASYGKLVKACHGLDEGDADDALFLTRQLKAKSTLAQAQANWMKELKSRAGRTKTAARKPGVKPMAHGRKRSRHEDPASEFRALVQAKVQAGMPRHKAVSAANRERPELREAMIEAANR